MTLYKLTLYSHFLVSNNSSYFTIVKRNTANYFSALGNMPSVGDIILELQTSGRILTHMTFHSLLSHKGVLFQD